MVDNARGRQLEAEKDAMYSCKNIKTCELIVALFASCLAVQAVAQDIPDPNPVPNGDGTYTWYTGINTQYPVIQEVVEACTDGDEIVIVQGQYVESLNVERADVTIRPATSMGATDANDGWQMIVFWNPTEGFENNNCWAIRVGEHTSNTYIGRPREVTRLANGNIVPTQVPVGGVDGVTPRAEWVSGADLVDVCNTAYVNPHGNGNPNGQRTRMQDGLVGSVGDYLATVFWSRSINDVAVRSHNGLATFSYCDISSQNGFGGGALLTGDLNETAFVSCDFHGTYSGGQQECHGGYGSLLSVHCISIYGGNPMFAGCRVWGNLGSATGVIHQEGGTGSWSGCEIGLLTHGNISPVSDGIYHASKGAHPMFNSCTFCLNESRFGTVFFDSTDNGEADHILFSNCIFSLNTTVDDQWGATMHCTDDVPGRDPLCVFDRCIWRNQGNNGGTEQGTTAYESDVRSNYFPRYRLLRDVSTGWIRGGTQSAGVANADNGDIESNIADLNGDGIVDGGDLAILLGEFGS